MFFVSFWIFSPCYVARRRAFRLPAFSPDGEHRSLSQFFDRDPFFFSVKFGDTGLACWLFRGSRIGFLLPRVCPVCSDQLVAVSSGSLCDFPQAEAEPLSSGIVPYFFFPSPFNFATVLRDHCTVRCLGEGAFVPPGGVRFLAGVWYYLPF